MWPMDSGQKKEMKGIYVGNNIVKLSLCSDGMIVYVVNKVEGTEKLLELTTELGKFAGYKINLKITCISVYQY